MRLVLDTNTVLSGLLWSGAPAKLIDAAQAERIELFTSAPLLAELQGVLMRSKFTRQLTKRALVVNEGIPIVTATEALERISIRRE